MSDADELARLREENRMLRSLVRDAPVAIVALDLERNVQIWNLAAERTFGWTEAEVIGRQLPHVPADNLQQSRDIHRSVVEGGEVRDVELERLTKGGEALRVNLSTAPLRDFDQHIIGLMAVYEDITEATPAADLQIPFRGLVEQSVAGLYIIQDLRFQYVNPRWAAMFGRSVAEMTGQPVADFIAPEDQALVTANLQKRISGEAPSIQYELRGIRPDHSRAIIEVHGTRFQYCGRPAVIGVGIDVTAARQREQELEASREALRELSQHLISVREEQRAQIAREVHDVLGGTLTALKLDLGWLAKRVSETPQQERLDSMLATVRAAIDTVRRISADLRPAALDNLGLFAALDWETREFARRLGVGHHLDFPPGEPPLTPEQATAIFRVVQEAFTNIARHANASHITLHATWTASQLTVTVTDNGCGVGADTPRLRRSLGVLGMTERMRQIGGELHINSAPGQGTQVLLSCPLSPEAA